jgi:Holliday junction resolvase
MNSREKGKRGERQWRDELRANGYAARRGQQFSGSPESPDVVCPSLPFHFEVKVVQKLNIWEAIKQAIRDALGKVPIVAHKRNFGGWLVTMEAETFFKILRRDFTQGNKANEEQPGHAPNKTDTRENQIPQISKAMRPEIKSSFAEATEDRQRTNKGTNENQS